MVHTLNFFNDKRILITGGGGYLGSKLAERLTSSNASIYLFDIRFNDLSIYLAENFHNLKLIEGDITQEENIEKTSLYAFPDYVFHFAASLDRRRDFSTYRELYNINVKGTLNLLESLKGVPYKGLYFSSSSEIYGTKNQTPFHEEQVPSPVSPYSLSKVMAEQLITTYSEINHKPFSILRIFNFFGPDMSENFFLNQLLACLKSDKQFNMTGGKQVRDFIHVEDLLNAIIEITMSEKCNSEIINICSGKGVILKEMATEIARQMGKMHLLNIGALPYRVNEVWEMLGDNSKLSRLGIVLNDRNFQLNVNNNI
jgi:nucleoside-diphosphate-sugar epimerase